MKPKNFVTIDIVETVIEEFGEKWFKDSFLLALNSSKRIPHPMLFIYTIRDNVVKEYLTLKWVKKYQKIRDFFKDVIFKSSNREILSSDEYLSSISVVYKTFYTKHIKSIPLESFKIYFNISKTHSICLFIKDKFYSEKNEMILNTLKCRNHVDSDIISMVEKDLNQIPENKESYRPTQYYIEDLLETTENGTVINTNQNICNEPIINRDTPNENPKNPLKLYENCIQRPHTPKFSQKL